MLMPGLSSARIPLNVRLFLAFSISLALSLFLSGQIAESLRQEAPATLIRLFISETLAGALIGFLGRIYFGALETLSTAVAMSVGLTSALSGPMDHTEPLPPITSLIILAATALIFITDLHLEVIRGLAASYSAIPVSGLFDARFNLVQVAGCLSKSFFVSLRISSPFIVYALIVNFAIGVASKLAAQIPVYFVTAPAVIAGGLLLLYATCRPFLAMFNEVFSAWLAAG
jgi:flagellar biosynthetic protein FliR